VAVFVASVVIALGTAAPVRAQSAQPADSPEALQQQVEDLRQQLDTVRREYDSRLAALEQQLAALKGAQPAETTAAVPQATPTPPPTLPEQAQAPPTVPATGMPQGQETPTSAGVAPSPSTFAKIFNPDIAVIGNMLGAAGRNTIEPSPAFDLAESEASFQAIVDPYARADFFLSFSPEGVEVEEGFVTFTSLPAGVLLKAGKMRAQFGKVNTMHSHTMPWVDRPLVTRNLVGGEDGLSQAGVSASKLFPNSLLFLEATGEVYAGSSDLFQGPERSDLTYVGRIRGYRDLTEGTNLDVGSSIAWGPTDIGVNTDRRLIGVDATFRWRPLRRAIYRRFVGRSELVWSHDAFDGDSATSFGMYASGEYQFAQRWYAGGRYDYSERQGLPSAADKGIAALVTFWPSEFNQIRGEYRRTRYADGTTANELLFQFLFSIGAHGAHVF
jgi:hypothetical protein